MHQTKLTALFLGAAIALSGCTTQNLKPLAPAARTFGPPLAVAVSGPLVAAAISHSIPAADSPFMEPHSLQVLMDGPEDRARVVFMRPAHFNHPEKLLIVDGEGRYLGDSLPESYFTADVAPGTHMFVGVGVKAAPIDAILEAGKTYYVLVQPYARFGRRTGFRLLRALPERDDIDGWLRDSTRYEVDREAGQAWLDGQHDRLQPRLREASRRLWRFKAHELERRTLAKSDGR